MKKYFKIQLSQRIVDHLIQAILIFASVFLAFWLSDYRQDQNDKKLVQTALESVLNEISSNLGVLERLIPNLESTISELDSFMENYPDTLTYFDPTLISGGNLRFNELLTNDSYQYLNQNNIFVDIQRRLLINRVYKQQEYVEDAIQDLMVFFKERELFDPKKTKENYVLYDWKVREIEGQTSAMINTYKYALEELSE
jgi:hypothetical protein